MEKKKALLYMLAAALLFCFTEISLKKLNGSINSIEVNFSRYLLAGILLLPAGIKERKRRRVRLGRRHIQWFFLLGFIGIALVGPLYQLATVYLDAGVTGDHRLILLHKHNHDSKHSYNVGFDTGNS